MATVEAAVASGRPIHQNGTLCLGTDFDRYSLGMSSEALRPSCKTPGLGTLAFKAEPAAPKPQKHGSNNGALVSTASTQEIAEV